MVRTVARWPDGADRRAVAAADCVAVLTPHKAYDLEWIADHAGSSSMRGTPMRAERRNERRASVMPVARLDSRSVCCLERWAQRRICRCPRGTAWTSFRSGRPRYGRCWQHHALLPRSSGSSTRRGWHRTRSGAGRGCAPPVLERIGGSSTTSPIAMPEDTRGSGRSSGSLPASVYRPRTGTKSSIP